MIFEINIRNFKSLQNVRIPLNKFNCFVGGNGAGKSTILQALDFISRQMHGDLAGWLADRGWEEKDLLCKTDKYSKKLLIEMEVMYLLVDGKKLRWWAMYDVRQGRCIEERIYVVDEGIAEFLMSLMRSKLRVGTVISPLVPVTFEYQGSILSQLNDDFLKDLKEVLEFRDGLRSLKSLELLSPLLLRKSSRSQDKDIGVNGEKLSGYLDTFKGGQRENVLSLLRKFYPQIKDFKVRTKKGGWKSLFILEEFMHDTPFGPNFIEVETEAAHINDGLLRILAVLAQTGSSRSTFVLLDEIENGINPEIVEKLVDLLVQSRLQIVVTTHSPMILNYLSDELARDSVLFVYKTTAGTTKVRKFFGIPRTANKLDYMGPGEAFVDTDLDELTNICVGMDASEEQLEK